MMIGESVFLAVMIRGAAMILAAPAASWRKSRRRIATDIACTPLSASRTPSRDDRSSSGGRIIFYPRPLSRRRPPFLLLPCRQQPWLPRRPLPRPPLFRPQPWHLQPLYPPRLSHPPPPLHHRQPSSLLRPSRRRPFSLLLLSHRLRPSRQLLCRRRLYRSQLCPRPP